MTSQTMGVYWEGALPIEPRRKDTLRTIVEGLNVINDPKCNKVLNVITFCHKCNKLLSYRNYSNKRRICGDLISGAALIRVNMVLRGITMVLSAALK